ncbi:MAG: ribonuclease Y [Candidatus Colwellbacteria bacterium RIFCSPHIGHO2_02_FULL_45_17]|uniref:Ribonuclease Y n=2 Tax=Candidatus Colwelliibacteriota TaxID=1817904 RepID=A0A1G1ZBB9_9BACT|nr:MAG: ribonuclease Y [Candidatus Colwellbacteria bacterium RIFCSPHIGHO2_02_FULL_45_17]OGY61119.1 MAG: ribonuclease Y [Candidatus Colwellbacteria bacterium RIFCSPLOWO2_02_FULL_45_11]OGY61948.1 MAG: ribonuclease Y [Candidatus Colwellbacteria bacterium RIFCSPLOWO2_12_FULL_46_17]
MLNEPLVVVGIAIVAIAAGYFIRYTIGARRINSLENKLQEDLRKAKNKAQDIVLEAKNKAVELLDEAKEEDKERKASLDRLEERFLKKDEEFGRKEDEFRKERERLEKQTQELAESANEIEKIRERATEALAEAAGLTKEEAKQKLLTEIQNEHREELAKTIANLARERNEEVEKKSVEIITAAMQRYSRSHVSELTTSVFTLPSEDLKGKIIGREGRNIRTLERMTGTEFIIDETPESIIISSFDPLRREIARLTLQKLIKDGRIQPAKIEEKVEEAKSEIEQRMQEIGEEAAQEIGVYDFPKEIVQLLGRLNFRTSFGQNVLTHSIEMAHLAGMIAAELGANVDVAKKGALLHDIGKAIDHEVPGTHVELGRKILKKYGIDTAVIAAMESHHEEYPFSTPESFIVAAVDALSAARPGARRGTLESYVKRLEDLERIAMEFKGVKQAYAVSAGRELRVFVVPEQIDDFMALQLARDVAAKIQSELKYPGEIKVNVIREVRAVEYAK